MGDRRLMDIRTDIFNNVKKFISELDNAEQLSSQDSDTIRSILFSRITYIGSIPICQSRTRAWPGTWNIPATANMLYVLQNMLGQRERKNHLFLSLNQ